MISVVLLEAEYSLVLRKRFDPESTRGSLPPTSVSVVHAEAKCSVTKGTSTAATFCVKEASRSHTNASTLCSTPK
jgi:hypothetical protein